MLASGQAHHRCAPRIRKGLLRRVRFEAAQLRAQRVVACGKGFLLGLGFAPLLRPLTQPDARSVIILWRGKPADSGDDLRCLCVFNALQAGNEIDHIAARAAGKTIESV